MRKTQILTKLFATALLMLAFGYSALAQKSIDNSTLVTISDDVTTVDEFMRVYNKNNNQSSMQEATPIPEYLDLYINGTRAFNTHVSSSGGDKDQSRLKLITLFCLFNPELA